MSYEQPTMSVPPEIIRVKRKRGEDTTPVAYLELQEAAFKSVEDTKRRRSGGPRWVYQRRDIQVQLSPHGIQPVIHSSRPEERGDFLNAQHGMQGGPGMLEERRQFYMSRSFLLASQESAAAHQGGGVGGGSPSASAPLPSKKRRYGTAVFIERDVKKSRQEDYVSSNETAHHTGPDVALEPPLPIRSKGAGPGAQYAHPTPALENQDQRLGVGLPRATFASGTTIEEPRKYKRPGRSSRIKRDSTGQAGEGGEASTAAAPTRPLPQFHGDMEKLAAEMDAWTLDQIDRNLAKLDHEEKQQQQQQASKTLRSPPSARLQQEEQQQRGPTGQPGTRNALRFMPKAPARRYAERHPEGRQQPVATATAAQGGEGAMVVDGTLDEEGDWVEIVYQRVPASKLDSTVPAKDIGVIILGDEEEKEFFYGADDDDSDAEKFEDEEDENAEDYYGADYPEDEIDSDDEYGYNPYQFRTGNASDEEQFGNDEFDYISDDDDGDILDGDNDADAIRKIHKFVSRHRASENRGAQK